MAHRQRVGALAALPHVLRELGQDPARVLTAAGIAENALFDPESTLDFATVGRLLEVAVDVTGCQHLGLLIGRRAGLASLGLVGELMRHAPNLHQAVIDLCANQARHVSGSVVYLAIVNDAAFWGYGVHHPGMPAVEHYSEGAVAVGANLLRELSGLSPDEVLLARRPPADAEPYRRFFGILPQFEAEQNALVISARHLALPVRGADPAQRDLLERKVAGYWAVAEPSTAQKVSRSLRARVVTRTASLAAVAGDLNLHPRTLNRRLLGEGATFRELLNEARIEVARQLLSVTSLKVAVIGEALGYADPSGFTRAFERQCGMPPRAWQALHARP